jgi:hypothetical protein
MSRPTHQQEIERALIRNYNEYAEGLDSKNWDMVRNCFADQVRIDYGSISDPTGSPDVPRLSDEWMIVLQSVINGFDITRHTITNHRFEITGDTVRCNAYMTADHVIFADPEMSIVSDQDVATVVGEYSNEYQWDGQGWKICYSSLVINWSRGNAELFVQAAERVAASLSQ